MVYAGIRVVEGRFRGGTRYISLEVVEARFWGWV